MIWNVGASLRSLKQFRMSRVKYTECYYTIHTHNSSQRQASKCKTGHKVYMIYIHITFDPIQSKTNIYPFPHRLPCKGHRDTLLIANTTQTKTHIFAIPFKAYKPLFQRLRHLAQIALIMKIYKTYKLWYFKPTKDLNLFYGGVYQVLMTHGLALVAI